jgi:DNA-binding response OmpR family regulator
MDVYVLSAGQVLPELVRRPLLAAGHTVTVFAQVDTAIAAAKVEQPRVIVVSRRVGSDDGIEALTRFRGGGDVPRALVLVSPDERDAVEARGAGAGFLRVPFTAAELLDVVGAISRGRKLILLADDSALIHKHTVPVLEEAGYDVVSAFDGKEALELADERHPDLIITDVEMPHLDGYAVCKTLKERPASPPVIICSALGETQDLERGFDSGADDYLVKPAVPEELVSRVRTLLLTSGVEAGRRERLLVADDSPAIRHLIADALTRQGFAITTAEDGQEAIERARKAAFDMIITDYDMPRMTGFEFVHALKRDPVLREIPTMMLTARSTRRDQAQMRAVGLTTYLVKPFAVDKCVAMVERILAERRLIKYKEASRLYISEGAVRAAEEAAIEGDPYRVRADERNVAVLFSDICGFTNLSSRMQPREVVTILNEVFDVLCPPLKAELADIDKFIGDAIMAIFEEKPNADPAALRAVRAGLAMQVGLSRWTEETGHPLAIRVGINIGPVVRGDIGSRHVRRDYTVIGDVVNRAQRFESSAPKGGVLVGPGVYAATHEAIDYESRPALKLKGVDEPVDAWLAVRVKEPV